MINFDYNSEQNSLIACSFGPDSMALLSMLLSKGIKPIVCHVNYHTRKESQFEEDSLKTYCEEKGLIFECLDASKIKKEGNFEAWARSVRYLFFRQMYVKYNAQCLFIGHQQDDLLETYVLQKDRNSVVARYGLAQESTFEGMRVIRPLLVYTKQDLLDYCIENSVPYSIDVTNFETKLRRNKIRHEIISKLNAAERDHMLDEISNENRELEAFESSINEKIEISDELDIRTILALDHREFRAVIRKFINKTGVVYKISSGQLEQIRKMCLASNPNIVMDLDDTYAIAKEYDVLVILEKSEPEPYSYELASPSKLDSNEFELDFSMGAEDRGIHAYDYPITIRSPLPGDEVVVGGNICTTRRLFIDWKMPTRLRKVWPIICDKNNKIIYVPRYRKNYIERHTSKLNIKF